MSAPESVLFGHLSISFDNRVLRPREWTVAQSMWAAELLRQCPRPTSILELFAGAGHIGLLALSLSAPSSHRLVAVDANPAACAFARRNAEVAGLADRVEVREGLIDGVLGPEERYALVIADPPWVETDNVTQHPDDPELAIDGGPDGLDLARACVRLSERHLAGGGSLLLQVGNAAQVSSIEEYLPHHAGRLAVDDVRLEPGRGALMHIREAG